MSAAIACIFASSGSAASSTKPAGLPPASPSGNALNRTTSGIQSSVPPSGPSHLTRIEAQPGQRLHHLDFFVRQVGQQRVREQVNGLLPTVQFRRICPQGNQSAV